MRAEMGRDLGPDAIAQRMQHGAQGRISMMPVARVEALHQVLEPEIGLLDRLVESVEACAHGVAPQSNGDSRNARSKPKGPP